MRKIAIAYALRQFFMMAAAQIHSPTGWSTIDRLQRDLSGGTLRVRTLVKRINVEFRRINSAINLYKKNRKCLKTADGGKIIQHNPKTKMPALLEKLDIKGRARVQMALWQVEHGDDFEQVLEEVIHGIRYSVILLKRQVKALKKKHHPNTVFGNLQGPSVQVQAYLAVVEAVQWTTMIPYDGGYPTADTQLSVVVRDRGKNTEELIKECQRERFVLDRKVDPLFLAMRAAFLQDDDSLPSSLWVIDPTTKPLTKVRFHDRAARIKGRHYTLAEQLEAQEKACGLAYSDQLECAANDNEKAYVPPLDFDIKRQVTYWLANAGANDRAQLYAGRDMVRQRVIGDITGIW